MTGERDFHHERLIERIAELRQLHDDDETFKLEAARLFEAMARNEAERVSAQQLLGALTGLRKFK